MPGLGIRAPSVGWKPAQLALSAAFLFGAHAAGAAAWPSLLALFGGERALFCWGTFALHVSLLLSLNGALAVLYTARLPAVEACKISPKPWPWRSPSADERARFWRSTAASLATVAFNNVAVALPSTFSTYDLVAPHGMLPAGAAAFPALATVVWQVAACAVVEDVLFYHFHRFLHTPAIYGYVHKWHHQWSHSIGIASETAHPVEFYLGNLVPLLAGPLLVRAHVFTLWVWLAVRIFETVDAHCGYDFPWSPARLTPWTNSTAAHDYHHAHNKGCYGSMFSVLDALYGTDADFEAAIKAGADGAGESGGDAPPPATRAPRRQRVAA